MARVGLGWTNQQLAENAQVAPNTVSNFENGRDIQPSSKQAIERALLSSRQVRFEGANCVCIVDKPSA
jgi:DNA-binding XRE family transcriptional regulator